MWKVPVMSARDLIALEAAREIMALPNNMPEGKLKATVQCIVLEAIRRATSSDMGSVRAGGGLP